MVDPRVFCVGSAWGGVSQCGVGVGSVLASRPPCGAQWGSMGPLVFLGGGGEDGAIAGDPRVFCVGSAWG